MSLPPSHLARKRFGQHFLTDESVIAHIVRALAPQATDQLVEIGPGLGALTHVVLTEIPHLQVVEIDRDLSHRLKINYPEKITVHEGDGLKFDYRRCLEAEKTPKIRVFGNLPYNISTPLLFHLLSFSDIIEDMLFMLQKEVVMRMGAKTGEDDYGRLSIMIQYHCQVTRLFDVDRRSFSPPPKVTSSVVALRPHITPTHPIAKNYKNFAHIVNVAFQHRRKTLKNALGDLVPPAVYAALAIDPIRRPETLSLTEFVNLSNALEGV